MADTPEQLSFLEIGNRPPKTDRLFLALFPDPAAAGEISKLAKHLSRQYGVTYPTTPVERLHVSLYHVGDFFGVPQGILDRVRTAADSIALPSFRATFDRVASFYKRWGRRPLVLRASEDAIVALARLYSELGAALAKQGFEAFPVEFFVPHVTLLRDEQTIDQPVDTIGWTVREFVLVHRQLAGYDYELVYRWPLRG